MQRDKVVGGSLLIIGLIVTPVYLAFVLFPAQFVGFFGVPVNNGTGLQVRVYAALIPVIIGVLGALLAGVWIGLSIVTSPPENKESPPNKQQ
jgi:hypothetical protein